MQLARVQTKHPLDAGQTAQQRKADANPLTPFALFQNELPLADLEARGRRIPIYVGHHLQAHRAMVAAQRIGGAFDRQHHAVIDNCHRHDTAARHRACGLGRVVGVIGERAERAFEIRRAHPGQRAAGALNGRIVGGHADHGHRNAVLGQDLPKRAAGAKRPHARLRERQQIRPDGKLMRRLDGLRHR